MNDGLDSHSRSKGGGNPSLLCQAARCAHFDRPLLPPTLRTRQHDPAAWIGPLEFLDGPSITFVFSPSNIAKEWCAKAGMAEITTVIAARPSARIVIEVFAGLCALESASPVDTERNIAVRWTPHYRLAIACPHGPRPQGSLAGQRIPSSSSRSTAAADLKGGFGIR
jgi:hypothetical protein